MVSPDNAGNAGDAGDALLCREFINISLARTIIYCSASATAALFSQTKIENEECKVIQ